MKTEMIAVPIFQERISPLMDVSNRYVIYETEDGEIKRKIDINLNADGEPQRIEKLKDIGVDTIICGAVSGCVAHIINEKGMRLLPMIYGPVEEIIEHYLTDTLGPYCMGPGNCTRGKRQRRGKCVKKSADTNTGLTGEENQ